MKFKKINVGLSLGFIISPYLLLPFTFNQIKKRNLYALILFVLTISLISFSYIPNFSNDKTRYLELALSYENQNVDSFIQSMMIGNRADFIFHTLIYLFAKLKINIQFLFLFLSFNTLYILYFVWIKICCQNKINENTFILGFLLVLFSVSLPSLFSGVRYIFALSIFILSLYFYFSEKRYFTSILLLIISLLTHFSLSYFVPAFLIVSLWRKFRWYKTLFIFSFIFLFIPNNLIVTLFDLINLPESYNNKIDTYLGEEDVLLGDAGKERYLVYYIRASWMFIVYLYLLINKRDNNNVWLSLLYICSTLLNMSFSFPTVFERYSSLIKFLFVLVISQKVFRNNLNRKYLYFSLVSFASIFITDIYLLRYNLMASIFKIQNLNLISILSNSIKFNDILK